MAQRDKTPKQFITREMINHRAVQNLKNLYLTEDERGFLRRLSPDDQKYYFRQKSNAYWMMRNHQIRECMDTAPTDPRLRAAYIDLRNTLKNAQSLVVTSRFSDKFIDEIGSVAVDPQMPVTSSSQSDREPVNPMEIMVIRDKFVASREITVDDIAKTHRLTIEDTRRILTDFDLMGVPCDINAQRKILHKLGGVNISKTSIDDTIRREIENALMAETMTQKEIALAFGVSQSTVSRIRSSFSNLRR